MSNKIKILKSASFQEIEKNCNDLLEIGYELKGEMKIFYIKEENQFIYHQTLTYNNKSILQKYSWSDWE